MDSDDEINTLPATKTTEDKETINDVNTSAISDVPNRPVSAVSTVTGRVLDIDAETISQLESPIVSGPGNAEDEEDDEDGSAGYEESAERDEIIRERINRTQEQMR